MGSLGFSEILLILVIGFLIFGPEKLPSILRNIGKTLKKIFDVKDDLQSSLYDIKNSIDNDIMDDNIYRKSKTVKIKKPKNIEDNKKINKENNKGKK